MTAAPRSNFGKEFARLAVIALIGVLTSGSSLVWDKPLLGGLGVLLAFAYTASLLFAAAYRSDVKNKSLKPRNQNGAAAEWSSDVLDFAFPTRTAGIIVIFLLLATIVSGFAGMYLHADIMVDGHRLTNVGEALYFSFATFSTLGHWDYALCGASAHILVALEVLGGMLLLILLFALLVARLADW